MKSATVVYISAGCLAVALIFCVVFIVRYISNVATPITVHEVEPGVRCATMVTADGAAIDCWLTTPDEVTDSVYGGRQ